MGRDPASEGCDGSSTGARMGDVEATIDPPPELVDEDAVPHDLTRVEATEKDSAPRGAASEGCEMAQLRLVRDDDVRVPSPRRAL